jgi:hypothetical protein
MGDLQDPAGGLLTVIPESLVHPFGAETLAEAVVKLRPDRYVLTEAEIVIGRPDAFDLRERGPGLDLARWRRMRNLYFGGLLAVGGIVAVRAFAPLFK